MNIEGITPEILSAFGALFASVYGMYRAAKHDARVYAKEIAERFTRLEIDMHHVKRKLGIANREDDNNHGNDND